MDKFILKMILALVKIFAGNNVDFDKLKVIAETKVLMDRRRSPANFRQKQRKEMKNPLLMTLFIYCLFGFFIALMIMSNLPMLVSLIVFHGYLLFMMAMTLVTDFSSVLLDTTDNQIILPKPISGRTLFMARVVHILVYLLQFTISLSICPLVATFISFGMVTGLMTFILLPFTIAFAVFITYLLYALILRFANEQKVKDIIGYFQIFMTIFFAVGFQIIPRMINFDNLAFTFHLHWYSYLMPPVWMAVATEAVHNMDFDIAHIAMLVTAFLVPVFTVLIMIKWLAPSFSRKLGALTNEGQPVAKKTIEGKRTKDLAEKFSPVICNTAAETAGFEKVWKITARDKNFKIQFYPSLAYLVVFIFIFVFKSPKNFSQTWQALPDTKSFLFFIYIPVMSFATSLQLVAFNDNYAAAWVYQRSPLVAPGEVISGMIKALLIKFFVPIYLLFFAFAFYVWGAPIVDDFVFGFFNNLVIFLLMANLSDHYLPFSRQPNIKEQSGKFVRIILQMLIIGVLIGIHYAASKLFWLPAALIPVSATGAYFLLRRIRQLPWLKISI